MLTPEKCKLQERSKIIMKVRFRCLVSLAVAACCIFFLPALRAEDKRPARPEDFVDIREVGDVQLSPDGVNAVFVVTEPADPEKPVSPRKSSIWVVPVDGSRPARPLSGVADCDASPRFSPLGGFLAFISSRGISGAGGEPSRQIFLQPAAGRMAEKLTDFESGVEAFEWSPDGTMIAFTIQDALTDEERTKILLRDDAFILDYMHKFSRLWVLDVTSRKIECITNQDFHVSAFTWSPDSGELALISSPTPGENDILWNSSLMIVSRKQEHTVRTLSRYVGYPEAGVPASLDWSPDGRTICFTEYTPLKIGTWLALVPPEGGPVRRLLQDHEMTVRKARWCSDSRHIIADCRQGVRTRLVSIDTENAVVNEQAVIFAKRPDFSFTRNGRTLVYIGEQAHSAADVWALECGKEPVRLTDLHPQLGSLHLGDIQEISWKSSQDGLRLYGLVITPPDFENGKPRPTIVHIHGGPPWSWWLGWHGSWSLWGQLLASSGYVVFLPNPRGSTDQGWRFAQANLGDWGGGDFQDIMDGVDRLIERGIADPDRLGIGGWSYGGYMSAWAVTHTDRFRAAVVGAGITDLSSFHGTTDINPSYLNIYFPACSFPCRRIFSDHSPMNFLRACKTPVLVLHPVEDRRVPFGQGLQFYKGLKELGIETRMVAYPREGHGIGERAHQQDVLERVLAWFDRYLRNRTH